MAVNSINSNLAAYVAQQNITKASSAAQLSVARLSSGNRITSAKDDVSGLSIGTKLKGTVSTLKTALQNTAQGSSLLQIADGALGQISDILERQKALTATAGSGALSDADRALVDLEFQALVEEADRIADTTEFSGVKLLNGGIAGSVGTDYNTADGTTADFASSAIITLLTNATANDEFTVAGITFTLTDSAQGTTAASGKISIGSGITNTAANIAAELNEKAATDGRLANMYFANVGGTVIARWTGGDGAGTVSVTVSEGFSDASNTSANIAINIASAVDGLSVNRVTYAGAITSSLFANASTTAQSAGSALDLSDVKDNKDFLGKLGEGKIGLITANYTNTASTATFSLQVGDITYTTSATLVVTSGNIATLTFVGTDEFGAAKGGTFLIRINGDSITSFDTQSELDDVVAAMNQGLENVSFQNTRDVLPVSASPGDVDLNGVNIGDLSGLQFDFKSDDFSNVQIGSFTITAPGAGATDAVFEMLINGELYRSVSGIGNQIETNTFIALQNVNDSSKQFVITTGNSGIADSSTTTLDLGTQAKADAIAAAIKGMLGLDGDNATGLVFQVGTESTDTLGVKIASAGTAALFGGQTLSVGTQDDAATAASVIEDAISELAAIRANVGALQSRFAFAATSLQISIQNQDAARGELLDTDIASESTSYATAQVKLQAGISVLAQANQQLQSLLKLIG